MRIESKHPNYLTNPEGSFREKVGVSPMKTLGSAHLKRAWVNSVKTWGSTQVKSASSAAFPSTEEFVGQFSWNGNVVKTTSSAQITTSTPISFSYSTGKLSSSVTNVFTESLTASLTTGRLPASTTVVGSLALDEPVAPAIAPVWASGSTPDSSHGRFHLS
jgi:hypothetical protein